MKLRILAVFALLTSTSTSVFSMEPAQLKLGGSTQAWYKGAMDRKLVDPILLRYVYATRDTQSQNTLSPKIISIHPGTQFKPGVKKDYIFSEIGSDTQTLFDEPYFSMELFAEGDPELRPKIVFRAPNNHVYQLNFQKMSSYSKTAPLYNAILERLTNTSDHKEALEDADYKKILPAIKHYIQTADQQDKQPVENLGYILPGQVLTVLTDDTDVYLSKGNK